MLLVELGRVLLKLNRLLGIHPLINDGWCRHSLLLIPRINKLKVIAILNILTRSMLHILRLGNCQVLWVLYLKVYIRLWVRAWSLGLQDTISSRRNKLGSVYVHIWQRWMRLGLRCSLLLILVVLHLLKLLCHLLFHLLLLQSMSLMLC